MTAVVTTTPFAAAGELTRVRRRSRAWNANLVGGGVLLVLVLLTTLAAPLFAWAGPNQTFPGLALLPPQGYFPFGTDSVGRDLFARVLYGGRLSLLIAVPSVGLATALGLLIGVPAGYWGGRVDQVLMRFLDVFFAFPAILLAILVVSILGPSVRNLILTIGLIYTPRMARIVRAPTLTVREREYVTAAQALGASQGRIVSRYLLPNIASPIIVEISLALGQVMLTESALSFLGFGPPPPDPSWGAMISQNRQFMEFAPWVVLAPCGALVLAIAAFLLVGQGLRYWLDPRQER